jgi:hypothetical protein
MTAALMFLLVLGGGFLFPWWWPALAGYALGFWRGRKGSSAFGWGFLGTACAWLALAALVDWRNDQILSQRVAALFGLSGPASPYALLLMTACGGGLVGGLGAWAGQSLRAWRIRLLEAEGSGRH